MSVGRPKSLGGQDQLCRTEDGAIERKEKTVALARRKYKAGLAMSQHKLSAEQLQEIHDLAAGWGKIIARRLFGESGPDTDIDFQTLEQIAAAAARGLTSSLAESLVGEFNARVKSRQKYWNRPEGA